MTVEFSFGSWEPLEDGGVQKKGVVKVVGDRFIDVYSVRVVLKNLNLDVYVDGRLIDSKYAFDRSEADKLLEVGWE